jgi:two-component system chemotaxis sensor kinase CheA
MDEMKEIIEDFLSEAHELLDGLDQNLVELERQPNNTDLLNDIFRSFHTIKGAGGFLGFNQVVELSHNAENLLNKLRQGEILVNAGIMDILLQAVDIVKNMINDIARENPQEYQLEPLYQKIDQILTKKKAPSKKKTKLAPPPAEETGESVNSDIMPSSGPSEQDPEERLKAPRGEPDKTIRIDIDRLDTIMNLVGELVLARNRLIKLNSSLDEKYQDEKLLDPLRETTGNLSIITTDLQLAVMRSRMLPIKKVFSKFPRMARDLARDLQKQIELEISGEDTELDKSVIEEIGDPLVHILRNSADHGIESPEIRQAQGKPEQGLIKLSAYHEGDHIIIEIEDDGKGIDSGAVRAKAIEKGLIDEAESMRLSEKECLNMIFQPGFSTNQEVTDISGRGVGLDVVKTHIAKLNGQIDLITEKGKGSKFRLRIPLTVAIIPALMVGMSNEVFAIPLVSVIEAVRVSPEEIKTIDGNEVIKLRDAVLPLIRLSEVFDLPSPNGFESNSLYVVVIGLAEKRIGLIVERLFGQEEVVIKSLGDYFADNKEITGATITGDGRVVLILDIGNLVEQVLSGIIKDKCSSSLLMQNQLAPATMGT